ncbi:LysR substrate-binding domain-containing protein [Pseudomonas sp. QE6]|uniref:LysR substrate-binding domain-containing protein n=1 Tax=Pseudomonas sp. QE6 TaxID=3242491 RepID=UPI00352957E7
MIRPELLRTFVRVTELASFTQAGEQLGLPRSTVSEHIQTLEALLGARLLQRTTRKVTVTQDGLVLYERSKDMLAQLDELQGLFRQQDEALVGRLRVDMPTVMARKLVMPRLGEFLARHPALELEVSCTDRRVDLVREGFDCVVRVGAVSDPSVVARTLGRFPQVTCASPSYLAAHGVPETLDDLAGHRLIHYVNVLGSRPSGFEYLQHGQTRYLPMGGALSVNSAEAYESAAMGGLGIIQVPIHGVLDDLEAGRLVQVLRDVPLPPMDISLLYAHRSLPQRVRVFMHWLTQLLGEPGVLGPPVSARA